MNSSIPYGATLVSLSQWLADRGALTPEELSRIFQSLAAQVAAIHDQGFLHGDLTPPSIVVNSAAVPQLPRINNAAGSGPLDLAGDLLPPEFRSLKIPVPRMLAEASRVLALSGETLDARRIDVYQLGVLFVRVAASADVEAYLHQPLVSAKIPASLRRVVDRAIGMSPTHRITECRQLLAELERASQQEPETPLRGSTFGSDTDRGHSQSRQQPEEAPLERLGNYQIVGQIGSGGMGDVFKGYDADLDRFVAIKVLPPELARQPDFVARFRSEAAAVAKVEHPNIVPIYSIASDRGRHFFAMQFVEGQTLAQLLAEQTRQSPAETVRIIEQVVAGLAAAHRRGLVHRDIKPGNILLADGGSRALVADFGLAKNAGKESRMTATGLVMGTVDYLSPEQGKGKAVDARSDLYSVGVLLYQMLSGQLPFFAETPSATIFQHVYEPPPSLAKIAPNVPHALVEMVHRLLAKSPDERYQTCENLLEDLAAFRQGEALPHLKTGRVRDGEPRTEIVRAPQYEELNLVVRPLTSPENVWSWMNARQHLFFWLKQQAPEIAGRLANTEQQVDGAVFEYQRRCDALGSLVHEAEGAQRILESQLREHRAAAAAARRRLAAATDEESLHEARTSQASNEQAAAELEEQLTQQRSELEAMQLELAKTSARLASLKSQRDALRARLRMAQARYGQADGRVRKQRAVFLLVLGAAATIALLGAVIYFSPTSSETPIAKAPKTTTKAPPPEKETTPSPPTPPPIVVPPPTKPAPKQPKHALEPSLPPFAIEQRQPLEEPESLPNEASGPFAISVKKMASIPGFDSSSAILSVTYSPNGKLLAASDVKIVKIFDVATGEEKYRLTGAAGRILSLAFSHDGKALAAGCDDKTIRVWNVEQARLNTTIEVAGNAVGRIQYSPNDALIVAKGMHIHLWTSSGAFLGKLDSIPGKDIWPQCFAFPPNENRMAMTLVGQERDNQGIHLTLIRGERQQPSDEISQWKWTKSDLPAEDSDVDLRYAIHSPDGKTLAVFGNKRIDLIDIARSRIRSTLTMPPTKYFYSGAFSPDSSMIAAAGDRVTIWNARTGQELKSLDPSPYAYWSIDFSSQGKTFAVSTGSKVDIWEITDENTP